MRNLSRLIPLNIRAKGEKGISLFAAIFFTTAVRTQKAVWEGMANTVQIPVKQSIKNTN